jgi:hypothetical protein
MVCPGEVQRKRSYPGRVDGLAVGNRCAHKRRSLSVPGGLKT